MQAPFVRDVDRKEGVAHPLFPTLESTMKNKYEGDEPEHVKVLEGKLAWGGTMPILNFLKYSESSDIFFHKVLWRQVDRI